jgi:biopolymer transport protein ExbD
MPRKRIPEEEKFADLNMTPMIDVVFQLLIFFMLSMHFKEIEGKLLSTLPKDKGLAPSHVLNPELQEVRIVVCAGGDTRMHLHDKGKHEGGDPKDGRMCKVLVEKIDIGELFRTEDKGSARAPNRAIYKGAAQKVSELIAMTPSSRDPGKKAPVILDADSEVPYEHIIGMVNACKEVGIDNVEFAGNPRFDKYYGSGQKGQFQHKKQ